MKTCLILILVSFALSANAQTASSSNLFSELKGFARGTTGGLGGRIYVVRSTVDDINREGTLRYGVEKLTGPTWIVFDRSVFPATTKKSIYLKSHLTLRNNLTIDGRGSWVSIRKKYNWRDVKCEPVNSTYECDGLESAKLRLKEIIRAQSVVNVILTHLDFQQVIEGTEPYPGILKDTQGFGDVISINNASGTQSSKYYDRIWLNHLTFNKCGDECVGVTNNSTLRVANVTISNSRFANSYKGIILGNVNDNPFKTAVSIYGNYFYKVKSRTPRIQGTVAHVFNNLFQEWGLYISVVTFGGTGIYENNLAVHSNDNRRYFENSFDDANSKLYAQNNYSNGSLMVHRAGHIESTFPSGYQNLAQPFPGTFSYSVSAYRSNAGWVNAVNDVRR